MLHISSSNLATVNVGRISTVPPTISIALWRASESAVGHSAMSVKHQSIDDL